MTVGYILINVRPDREHKIYNYLSENPRILELRPLFREYDIIAKVETPDHKNFGNFISTSIRTLDGVIDTKVIE